MDGVYFISCLRCCLLAPCIASELCSLSEHCIAATSLDIQCISWVSNAAAVPLVLLAAVGVVSQCTAAGCLRCFSGQSYSSGRCCLRTSTMTCACPWWFDSSMCWTLSITSSRSLARSLECSSSLQSFRPCCTAHVFKIGWTRCKHGAELGLVVLLPCTTSATCLHLPVPQAKTTRSLTVHRSQVGCIPQNFACTSGCLLCSVQQVLSHPKLLQVLGINGRAPLTHLVDQYMSRARQLLEDGSPHVSTGMTAACRPPSDVAHVCLPATTWSSRSRASQTCWRPAMVI